MAPALRRFPIDPNETAALMRFRHDALCGSAGTTAGMSGKGGEQTYGTRLGKDRSPQHS